MVITALSRLPDSELDRLDVDLRSGNPILAGMEKELKYISESLTKWITKGSDEAKRLFTAWDNRQKELKEAVKSMLNAVEYMKSISGILSSNETTDGGALIKFNFFIPYSSFVEKLAALLELEGLLCDIDNARDFHTIGGWPVLAALLAPSNAMALQTAAAWAVGSAVKNSYDYQLWTTEAVGTACSLLIHLKSRSTAADASSNTTTLELLVEMIASYGEDNHIEDNPANGTHHQEQERLKKALYAVAAAARGNVDVQGRLYSYGSSAAPSIFLNSLYNISVRVNSTQPGESLHCFEGFPLPLHFLHFLLLYPLIPSLPYSRTPCNSSLSHTHILSLPYPSTSLLLFSHPFSLSLFSRCASEGLGIRVRYVGGAAVCPRGASSVGV